MWRNRGVELALLLLLSVAGVSAMQTRAVLLRIGLPNGASPELRVLEGETGTVSLPDVGAFGFLPVVHDDASVTVTVLDLTHGQRKQMADVSLSAGDVVTTDTTPKFSIRLVRLDRAPIPLTFLGVLEHDNKKAAILVDRTGQPTYAREGETVLGRYKGSRRNKYSS